MTKITKRTVQMSALSKSTLNAMARSGNCLIEDSFKVFSPPLNTPAKGKKVVKLQQK